VRVAARLYLHIGTQKSGTTYLQRILQALAPRLREAGVLYPTWTTRGDLVYNHEPATYGLLCPAEYPWVAERAAEVQRKPWSRLVDQVRTWRGPAIVSGEAISVIRPDAARALVSALGIDDTVVIITARDLGRVLPSSWQQSIRNGRSASFTTYLTGYARQRGPAGIATDPHRWDADPDQTFWRAYAIGSLVGRWAPLGTSVTVVGVPRRGGSPDELWHRFAAALDLGGALPETPPAIDDLAANVGLTEPEVLVLAAVNREGDRVRADDRQMRQLRGRIIREAFVTRPDRGTPVRMPRAWHDRVAAWAHEDVTALASTPARLIGDQADLLVDPEATVSDGPDPDEVARASAAAVACLAGLPSR